MNDKPDEVAELVKRLRKDAEYAPNGWLRESFTKAAATLTTLSRRNAELEEENARKDDMLRLAARAEGRREGIEEAAKIVKGHADVLNNTPIVFLERSVTQAKLRLLDWLYAAIRALAEKQP